MAPDPDFETLSMGIRDQLSTGTETLLFGGARMISLARTKAHAHLYSRGSYAYFHAEGWKCRTPSGCWTDGR